MTRINLVPVETFNNDYEPTPEAIKLNEDRIKERSDGF